MELVRRSYRTRLCFIMEFTSTGDQNSSNKHPAAFNKTLNQQLRAQTHEENDAVRLQMISVQPDLFFRQQKLTLRHFVENVH